MEAGRSVVRVKSPYRGLGSLKGKIWRIGLMGYNATSRNAQKVVEALRGCLEQTPAAA
jgi:aspartate aminotransferase-like enzyme